jgi:antitoxin component YwqK of YwqJK toxin-antitoxin module
MDLCALPDHWTRGGLSPYFRRTMPFRTALSLGALLLFGACSTHRFVAATHSNNKPEVVVYMKGKGEEAEKVMEKVYYANGQLEYVGRFANGVEHGVWEYFYENGTRKYTETWLNGREHGVHYDYSPDGQIYRELHYDNGRLVKEVDRTRR